MARSHLRFTLKDRSGSAIQNAALLLYLKGTTSPVTDAWNAESGGNLVTQLLTNTQGEGECWIDAPKAVDINVTDNGKTAFPVGNPASPLTWPPFLETVEALPPPDEVITTSSTVQAKAGQLQLHSIVIKEEWLDPRHPDFGGGAKCDNVTDDTAAWQALFSYIGDPTTMRAAEIFVPGGVSRVTQSLVVNRKSVIWHGSGVGARSGSSISQGSWIRWDGTTTDPIIQFRQTQQADLSGFGVVSVHTDPARVPRAAVSFHRDAGDSTVNTKNMLRNLVLGAMEGHDAAPTAGTYYVGAGILTEGLNFNNDQTIVDNVKVYAAETGYKLSHTQNVLWTFRGCLAKACGTSWYAIAQVNLDDCIAAASKVRDLDVAGGLWTLGRFSSEGGAQFARVRGTSKLLLRGGYFQYTNLLTGSGSAGDVKIIDADGDNGQQLILLEDFDFRDFAYTNPGTLRAVAMGFSSPGGALTRKDLIIRRCLFGSDALRPTHTLVTNPTAGTKVTVSGEQYQAKNASGWYDIKPFRNEVTQANPALDFSKDTATNFEARLSADQLFADNVLTDVTGFQFPIGTNEVWAFESMIMYDATTSNDIRVAFVTPSGTLAWGANGLVATATLSSGDINASATASSGAGLPYAGARAAGAAAVRLVLVIRGTVTCGPTAGTFKMQACKAANTDTTSPVDDTTIFTNSHMMARRVS